MSLADPVSLAGQIVSLVPLTQDHHDDLVAATQDGELWKLWYTVVPSPETMRAEIEHRLGLLKTGAMVPFAVIENASGRAVGMTTYTNIDADNLRLEIGYTWYRKSVQRTRLNTEAKLLLLSRAFEDLHCIAVELRTHAMNQQSRTAIERLGAKLDGILRHHRRMPNGSLRDTCVYSILAEEWPGVKARLHHSISAAR